MLKAMYKLRESLIIRWLTQIQMAINYNETRRELVSSSNKTKLSSDCVKTPKTTET